MLDLVVSKGLVVFEVEAAEVADAVREVFADSLVAEEGYLFFCFGCPVGDDGCDGEFVVVVVDDYTVCDVLVEWNDL